MALVKGTNSYATAAEADSYFGDMASRDAWSASAVKEQLLITATQMVDENTWTGAVIDEDQALAFPREGTYFDPKMGIMREMSEVPERIVNAVFEQAYHILLNDGLGDDTGGVTDVEVSGIVINNIKGPKRLGSKVGVLIRPLLSNSSGSWWRAN